MNLVYAQVHLLMKQPKAFHELVSDSEVDHLDNDSIQDVLS